MFIYYVCGDVSYTYVKVLTEARRRSWVPSRSRSKPPKACAAIRSELGSSTRVSSGLNTEPSLKPQ